MCTRYYLETIPDLAEKLLSSPLGISMVDKLARSITSSGEIRPMDIVPTYATNKSGKISVFPMVWGFKPADNRSLIINAKIETVAEKSSFKDSWLHHRCAVPASWFYEWEHHKLSDGRELTGDKNLIQPKGLKGFYFAGLYRFEEFRNGPQQLKYPVFTILTREADMSMREIHDRMPVMIDKGSVRDWINPKGNPESVVERALTEMVSEKIETTGKE